MAFRTAVGIGSAGCGLSPEGQGRRDDVPGVDVAVDGDVVGPADGSKAPTYAHSTASTGSSARRSSLLRVAVSTDGGDRFQSSCSGDPQRRRRPCFSPSIRVISRSSSDCNCSNLRPFLSLYFSVLPSRNNATVAGVRIDLDARDGAVASAG